MELTFIKRQLYANCFLLPLPYFREENVEAWISDMMYARMWQSKKVMLDAWTASLGSLHPAPLCESVRAHEQGQDYLCELEVEACEGQVIRIDREKVDLISIGRNQCRAERKAVGGGGVHTTEDFMRR